MYSDPIFMGIDRSALYVFGVRNNEFEYELENYCSQIRHKY